MDQYMHLGQAFHTDRDRNLNLNIWCYSRYETHRGGITESN